MNDGIYSLDGAVLDQKGGSKARNQNPVINIVPFSMSWLNLVHKFLTYTYGPDAPTFFL
jgi:hypothetical protein